MMKKIYVTPEIEYDNFELSEVVCANLYGGRNAEFYAIGNSNPAGSSGGESGIPGAGGGERD